MAENNTKTNTGILAKAQKRLTRTKTKVLQNLGKAEKTKDETFNTHVAQIEELQDRTQPVHKELNHYLHCVKNLCQANKNLHLSLQTVYEDEWPDKPLVQEQMKTFELLWNDYLQNFQDSVMSPMNKFLQHFPTFKTKISKRGRKLVDYDNARHQADVLQSAKKKDEPKIEKAQDELKEAKRIYDEMNQELLAEMPAFLNSRRHFFATLLTSIFGTEFVFQSEIGKVNASLGDICQKLANQSEPMNIKLNTSMSVNSENSAKWDGGSAPTSPVVSASPSSGIPSPTNEGSSTPVYSNQEHEEEKEAKKDHRVNGDVEDSDDDDGNDDDKDKDSDKEKLQAPECPPAPKQEVDGNSENGDGKIVNNDYENDTNEIDDNPPGKDSDSDEGNLYEEPVSPNENGKVDDKDDEIDDKDDKIDDKEADDKEADDKEADDESSDDDSDGNVYSQAPSNRPVHTPPAETLYQVQATHRYTGEDVDELNFDQGEIIYVIPFDNSDEQDDGWQMGIKQTDGIKGVFPENFTKKI